MEKIDEIEGIDDFEEEVDDFGNFGDFGDMVENKVVEIKDGGSVNVKELFWSLIILIGYLILQYVFTCSISEQGPFTLEELYEIKKGLIELAKESNDKLI